MYLILRGIENTRHICMDQIPKRNFTLKLLKYLGTCISQYLICTKYFGTEIIQYSMFENHNFKRFEKEKLSKC